MNNKNKKIKKSFGDLPMYRKWLFFIFLAILSVIALPAVLVLLIGLLPTITVLITDSNNSNKLIIVGGFNMSGVFIYLINVINHFSLDGAFSILSDAFNLVIMLGFAGIGFIIYYELPNLFSVFNKISSQKKIEHIEKRLAKISEEWGQIMLNRPQEKK